MRSSRIAAVDYAALLAEDKNTHRTEAFDLIGRSIANAHLLLDIEVVVLVGGVTALGEPFRVAVETAFDAACPAEFRHGLAIRLGALGTFCGAIGAAALWREDEAA